MSAARRKGSAWEQAVVEFLRARGWPTAERRVSNGRNDRGDIAGVIGVVVECKNARTTDLAGWWAEAEQERANDGARHAVLWLKRRGRATAGDGWVVMDGETLVTLLHEAGYGDGSIL